jgi:hypothetical protein
MIAKPQHGLGYNAVTTLFRPKILLRKKITINKLLKYGRQTVNTTDLLRTRNVGVVRKRY